MEYLALALLQYIILFLLSRSNIKLFFKIFKNKKLAAYFLTLLFFPGTVVHELSHFFAAIVLFLRVGNIEVFPTFEGKMIKLGRVYYERKDFIRGLLVGIAPLFAGSAVLVAFFYFNLFPSDYFFQNLVFAYIIFSISSTMFSSKQDLKDLGLVIPLFMFLAIVFYLLGLDFWKVVEYFSRLEGAFVILIKVLSIVILVQLFINLVLRTFYYFVK